MLPPLDFGQYEHLNALDFQGVSFEELEIATVVPRGRDRCYSLVFGISCAPKRTWPGLVR